MTLFGLPLHPLVVHAAVVLVPLVALATIVIAVSARARKRFGWLTLLGSLVAAGSAVAARFTGEALAGVASGMGLPDVSAIGSADPLTRHMAWGTLAPWPAGALVLAILLVMLGGRSNARPLRIVVGVLAIVVSLAAIVVVVVAGHAGATAVWGAKA